jgi:hypothetical protein
LTRRCPKDDSLWKAGLTVLSGGNNGIVLEVYIAFNPLANLPVWMGQEK